MIVIFKSAAPDDVWDPIGQDSYTQSPGKFAYPGFYAFTHWMPLPTPLGPDMPALSAQRLPPSGREVLAYSPGRGHFIGSRVLYMPEHPALTRVYWDDRRGIEIPNVNVTAWNLLPEDPLSLGILPPGDPVI